MIMAHRFSLKIHHVLHNFKIHPNCIIYNHILYDEHLGRIYLLRSFIEA
jgi:hypothetical protein